MKKLLSLTLALAIIICAVPLGTFTLTASAATSSYYFYSVSNGEATITYVRTSISGDITIPSTLGGYPVTSIGDDSFAYCESLTSVTIPNSVTSIGDDAFAHCERLTSVTIPDSITSIGQDAFYGCESLTEIVVSKNNNKYSSQDGVLFNKDKTILIQYPIGKTNTSYIIPDSVTSIGDSAFGRCYNLTSITIPNSVTSIGSSAFSGCTGLTSITIPNSVTSIGGSAFYNCTGLTSITIPDSVTSIGGGAFAGTAYYNNKNNWENKVLYIGKHLIDAIVSGDYSIKTGTLTIADSAFYNCTGLTSITIPDSVTSIGGSAFSYCTGLTSITIPDSVTSIGGSAFYNTAYYNDENYRENKVLYIGKHLIDAKDDISGEYSIKTGTLTIAGSAFSYCTGLTSITIPDSVTSIGEYAFSYCYSLRSITIPDSVTSIGCDTFSNCESLKNITIPDSVTSIGDFAFAKCYSLADVYYSGNLSQRNNIDIGVGNYPLEDAAWHYNKLYPDAASNAWYSEAVKYVRDNGIMSGYSNGKFGTSDSIQRQDFLVMLARLDGVNLNNYKYKSSFPDVARNSYYEAAVNWGAQNGIVTGYQNGKFGVGDKVTREQLVTFLYRYAKYKGYDYSYTADRETVVSGQYKDYKNVSGFAKDPILWAIEKGVISGKTSSTIAPQGNAQRCEVAKIMYNIFLNDIFN